MTDTIISRQDYSHLQKILEQAYRDYLKQSRLNQKPAFNILRVLAAFRILHPNSPSTIYNAIILIAKNYNPQSLNQWKRAIQELTKRKQSQKERNNYCRPQVSMYTKTYQNSFNRSRINDSQEHFQSKSYAQFKVPLDHSASKAESFADDLIDPKYARPSNQAQGKIQYYTKADSQTSKNHYISFQPYHNDPYRNNPFYDKENINSTNAGQSRRRSAYQYIQAIQRDLNHTSKYSQHRTPIDQSFIKNIISVESPYLLTNANMQLNDPIDDQMFQRANTFHTFNLELKGFNSLLANYLVFQKLKEAAISADMQNRSQMLHKTFLGLKANVEYCKHNREQQIQVSQHHTNKILRKTWNVFKLIYDLRSKKENIQIEKYNKISYEFILSLLFATNEDVGEQLNWLDFDNKIKQLMNDNKIDKIVLIVKYFGKQSWISQQSVQRLINSYKLSICRQVFQAFAKQSKNKQFYSGKREFNLSKQSFSILKIKWLKIRAQKKKIMEAQASRNKVLMSKVMRVFFETVYSTKLYSKRCEFIERKNKLKLKSLTLQTWLKQTMKKLTSIEQMKTKFESFIILLQKIQIKFCINKIFDFLQNIDAKTETIQQSIIFKQKQKLINRLKENAFDQYKVNQIAANRVHWSTLRAVKIWKQQTKKGKALSAIFRCINRFYFRKLIVPELKQSVLSYQQAIISEAQLLQRTFRMFVDWCSSQQQRMNNLIKSTITKINFIRKSGTLSRIIKIVRHQIDERERQQRNQKCYELRLSQNVRCKQYFLNKWMSIWNIKKTILAQNKQLQTKSVLKYKNKFVNSLYNYKEQAKNMLKLQKLVQLIQQKLGIARINSYLKDLRILKIIKIRKINVIKQLSQTSIFQSSLFQTQNEKAMQFYERKLKIKAINTLYQLKELSQKVAMIAFNFNKKIISNQIRQALQNWHKQIKITQIIRRIDKKQFFENLNEQNTYSKQRLKLKQQIFHIRSIQTLTAFKLISNRKNKQTDLQIKTLKLYQTKTISRIKLNYNHCLIHKKYLYMAYKFRAIKLSQQAFNNWKNCSQPAIKAKILPKRKGKMDRLSTDYLLQ